MRPALSLSSRALIPRARHFCLFAAAIHWCVRAVPHTKSADKGIGIVASPASFRQLIQVHEISAADDYILGFGGRDQSFDHILCELPPALFTDAFEAPVANVIFIGAL